MSTQTQTMPEVKAPPPAAAEETPQYYFSTSLVCLSEEETPATAAFAAMRTNLLSGHFRVGRRSLAVCGATPEAGSTFVAANIAVAIAQAGIKTLLVDANLGSPGLERLIMPPDPARGLRQMLQGGSAPVDFVCPDVIPNLSVLYSGGGGSGSSELIASREFKAVIDEFVRDYEFTVIDTPPSKLSPDSRRIAAAVRYALIVARQDVSYVADVRALIDELESMQANVVGTFLTDF